MNTKNILVYISVLLISFVLTGFLFSWLVLNNTLSPQSKGVQDISQIYNKVGYNISTPELTVELIESARKSGNKDKLLNYIDPSLKKSEKTVVAEMLFANYSADADLYLQSIETDDENAIIARIVVTEKDGKQYEDESVKLKKANNKWYAYI